MDDIPLLMFRRNKTIYFRASWKSTKSKKTQKANEIKGDERTKLVSLIRGRRTNAFAFQFPVLKILRLPRRR